MSKVFACLLSKGKHPTGPNGWTLLPQSLVLLVMQLWVTLLLSASMAVVLTQYLITSGR